MSLLSFAKEGDLESFKKECSKVDPTSMSAFGTFQRDEGSLTVELKGKPIHAACYFGQIEIIKYLIDTYGLDLTINDNSGEAYEVTQFDRNEGKGMTAIHWACYGFQKSVFDLLKKNYNSSDNGADTHSFSQLNFGKLKESNDLVIGGKKGFEAIHSNIDCAINFASKIISTYGPKGRDKLIIDENGEMIISNDGATILKNLKSKEPISQILLKLSSTQDEMIGDGTTSIVLFCSYLLKEIQKLILEGEENIMKIIEECQKCCNFILNEIEKDLQFDLIKKEELRDLISIPFHSKLLYHNRFYFSDLILESIEKVKEFNLNTINILSIPGGSLDESFLINGIVFPQTFYYAGYEQQLKYINNPKILLLNHEIELKHQKEFAKILINNPKEYDSFIDSEWKLIKNKLEKIIELKYDLIIDTKVIGDLPTQYFTQNNITNISRIPNEIMNMIIHSVNGTIQTSLEMIESPNIFGTCELYEERTIGNERYGILSGCKNTNHVTLVLRGSSDQILKEAQRSLNDSISVTCNILKSKYYSYGGGSLEMECSTRLLNHANEIDKNILKSYSNALENMVSTISNNCNLNTKNILSDLRSIHSKKININSDRYDIDINNSERYGIDILNNKVEDMKLLKIIEPSIMKKNVFSLATQCVCDILEIDFVVIMPQEESENEKNKRISEELKKRKYAEKKWKEFQNSLQKNL
eukprot:gene11896-5302_t